MGGQPGPGQTPSCYGHQDQGQTQAPPPCIVRTRAHAAPSLPALPSALAAEPTRRLIIALGSLDPLGSCLWESLVLTCVPTQVLAPLRWMEQVLSQPGIWHNGSIYGARDSPPRHPRAGPAHQGRTGLCTGAAMVQHLASTQGLGPEERTGSLGSGNPHACSMGDLPSRKDCQGQL